MTRHVSFFGLFALVCAMMIVPVRAQSPAQDPVTPSQAAGQQAGASTAGAMGQKDSGAASPKTGQDERSATKPASAGEQAASEQKLPQGPLDPAAPPTNIPHDRPVIGLALGGGGAAAMTEIGVLQWFEEHHIPVDVIAGTSMGSIISALYSTGKSPDDMKRIMSDTAVDHVFRTGPSYTARSFRRREDAREVPNAVNIGLKHGASLRNALLTDTGLNELLDKEFLNYNDQISFNDLPIPFRCQATDLNAAKTVTFARGSLQDAVRASASIPGVFRPFEMDGHEYVDGAILENLPTQDVKAMRADVILAVSLPLQPVGKGDLDSILGVLQRAFAVGIEVNEQRDRGLANVVVMPDTKGFTANDYLKTDELAKRGYEAAEKNRDALLKYALNDAQWEAYIEHRRAKERAPAGTVLMVKVKAPNDSVREAVQRKFAPLVNQPVNTDQVEHLLAEVRSDGRYDADYTVGYDAKSSTRPILLVTVDDKKTGPPFLAVGVNIAAQTAGVTRATVNTILLNQDLGGYGNELRTRIDFGFMTRVESEYYRKLTWNGFFAAPRADVTREPFYIYQGNYRVSERQSQFAGGGLDLGWGNGRDEEIRFGWQFHNVQWTATTGADSLADYSGNSQKVRLRLVFDAQDRALVPRYGLRSISDVGYLYATPGSPSAPQLYNETSYAYTFHKTNVFLGRATGATMFNRNVAQPFRYTLGGPLRLSASAIDQYRGTDYFLVTQAYLRRIAHLPAPLGQAIFVGGVFEAGQMRAPDQATITREDVSFGLVAETPIGVITVAPSIGNAGERKLTFTLGRLF